MAATLTTLTIRSWSMLAEELDYLLPSCGNVLEKVIHWQFHHIPQLNSIHWPWRHYGMVKRSLSPWAPNWKAIPFSIYSCASFSYLDDGCLQGLWVNQEVSVSTVCLMQLHLPSPEKEVRWPDIKSNRTHGHYHVLVPDLVCTTGDF